MAKRQKTETVLLQGASFQGFEFTVGPKRGEGSAMIVMDFTAPWNEANREAGGWEELPDTVSGLISLNPAEVQAANLQFNPRGLDGVELECSGATHFQVFIPTKEGEEAELRFKIKSVFSKAGNVMDRFGRTAGTAPGSLRLSTDPMQEQRTLIDEADPAVENSLRGKALEKYKKARGLN